MSINVPLPGQERKIVMVYLPPNGEPKPCYEDSLHIARDQGYVKYEPADANASQVIVPDETSEDRMAREERAREELEKRASQFLSELGITRLPNAECESCTGLGAVFSDEIAPRPCFACFPEAMELVQPGGAGSGKDDGGGDGGGEEGGGIWGGPEGGGGKRSGGGRRRRRDRGRHRRRAGWRRDGDERQHPAGGNHGEARQQHAGELQHGRMSRAVRDLRAAEAGLGQRRA